MALIVECELRCVSPDPDNRWKNIRNPSRVAGKEVMVEPGPPEFILKLQEEESAQLETAKDS